MVYQTSMFKIMQQTFFERFTLTFFLATTLSDQLGGDWQQYISIIMNG